MIQTDRWSDIVDTLVKILDDGLHVTSDTMHFAESTYGIIGEELAVAVADENFEDREILTKLLFFPTRKMRRAVEPLLAGLQFTDDDIPTIANQMGETVRQVSFVMPDGSHFSLKPVEEAVNHFVEKFYMGRHLDPTIVSALDSYLPENVSAEIKILMRCRDLSFSDAARNFLCLAVKKSGHQKNIREDVLALLFTDAAQVPEQKTIVGYLFEQRHHQKKLLNDIGEFQKKSNQYGMEYLMMQSYPVPHESEENVSELLRKYTIIIDDLLGLRNPKDDYINRQDMGSFDTGDDLDRLFRSLS